MTEFHAREGIRSSDPRLEFMARFTVHLVAPVWELGATSDLGRRRIIPITGGSLAGPLLDGEILNNGADWQIVTADGTAIIDTRYLLKLDDGSLAYLQTGGYRHGPVDVMAELAKGAKSIPRNTTSASISNSRRVLPLTAGSIAAMSSIIR